ncbi:MAG: F0F1 ATP synthase subunit B [Pseudomonadota bacterium]
MFDLLLIAAEGASGEEYVELSVFGITATAWVSIAMAILIGLILWKKVPSVIAASLDRQIDDIKRHLNEAKALREEAESMRAEYESKIASAVTEAEDMKYRAEQEAEAIIAEAKENATALIARRKKVAEQKIASAERAAIAEIRDKVASVSAEASQALVQKKHDAEADTALVDSTIATLGKAIH